MRIACLSHKFSWFGNHTGYNQLPYYICRYNPEIRVFNSYPAFFEDSIGNFIAKFFKWPPQSRPKVFVEFWFSFKTYAKKDAIRHLLYFELHHFFMRLKSWKKAPPNLVGTIHHPSAQWSPQVLENLKRLSSAIILYQRDLEFFESYVGRNRVKFIHHGVDTDFFCTRNEPFSQPKRILFVGQNARNTVMLYRIVNLLVERHPELHFDFLVRKQKRQVQGLKQLIDYPSVTWHEGLSDEGLRNLYQKSYLLLLPMNCCGANNSIVEALACGLPIVTTDVGGIRDYGGGSVYPVVANNDDNAMIDLIGQYISRTSWRNEMSRGCREFAEENLAWPLIANKHMEAYKTLVG